MAMVWSAVRSIHLFDDRSQLEHLFKEAPWRVQVTDAGEAAILERWRLHLDVLSVRGLWCSERRIAPLMRALDSVAVSQGYADLLSPVVPEFYSDPYVAAGMQVCQRIITMRLSNPAPRKTSVPAACEGVTLRLGREGDLDSLIAVDILAFDPFWRGDVPTIQRYLAAGRVAVAEYGGTVIGYTLATAERGEGMLGRLAVVPGHRGRGIGTLLLEDATDYLARVGVSAVSLCTQEGNAVSRSLYGRAGFYQVGGTSVFLAFGRTSETRAI